MRKARLTLSYLTVPSVYSFFLIIPDCDLVCRRGSVDDMGAGAENPGSGAGAGDHVVDGGVEAGAEDPDSWSEKDARAEAAADPGA